MYECRESVYFKNLPKEFQLRGLVTWFHHFIYPKFIYFFHIKSKITSKVSDKCFVKHFVV